MQDLIKKRYLRKSKKIFNITSWAGANITELINKWGNYTKKPKLQMVTRSILMKQDILETAENMNQVM
jgi:hypothetical protein